MRALVLCLVPAMAWADASVPASEQGPEWPSVAAAIRAYCKPRRKNEACKELVKLLPTPERLEVDWSRDGVTVSDPAWFDAWPVAHLLRSGGRWTVRSVAIEGVFQPRF